ncbi:MAG: hypothetical protein AMXMBFR53_02690 [Gemmatimonadota bacterium]
MRPTAHDGPRAAWMRRAHGLGALLVLLSTPGTLGAQSSPERLQAVRRFGSLDGPLAFTEIGSLVAVDTVLWVAQSREHVIRVVTKTGRLLQTLGGRGDGPGEYRRIDNLAFVDGEIVATDLGQRRSTFYDPAGKVLRTAPLPPAPTWGLMRWLGAPYAAVSGRMVLTASVPGVGEDAARLPVVLADSRGQVLDTLAWFDQNQVGVMIERDGRRVGFRHPLQRQELHSVSSDGRSFVGYEQRGDSLSVTWYDLARGTRATRRVLAPPVRVPRAYADSTWRAVMETFNARGFSFTLREVQAGMRFPATWPAANTVQAVPGGGAWLREPAFGGRAVTWRFLHRTLPVHILVRLDPSARILDQDERFVWATVTDEYGVDYIVAYPVPDAVRAALGGGS